MAAALLSVLAAMVMTMQAWRVLLAGLGSPLPVRPAARIMFIGQLGKYLPGSVWPVLAQMELGHAYQVPRHRSASASVLAMVVSLLSGLLTALVALPFVAGATAYRWAFALVPVLLAGLHPRVLNAILGRLLRVARRPPRTAPLTGRVMAAALAWSCSAWVLYGLQIWLLATRLGAPAGRTALLVTGRFRVRLERGFPRGVRPGRGGCARRSADRCPEPGPRSGQRYGGGPGLPGADDGRRPAYRCPRRRVQPGTAPAYGGAW